MICIVRKDSSPYNKGLLFFRGGVGVEVGEEQWTRMLEGFLVSYNAVVLVMERASKIIAQCLSLSESESLAGIFSSLEPRYPTALLLKRQA